MRETTKFHWDKASLRFYYGLIFIDCRFVWSSYAFSHSVFRIITLLYFNTIFHFTLLYFKFHSKLLPSTQVYISFMYLWGQFVVHESSVLLAVVVSAVLEFLPRIRLALIQIIGHGLHLLKSYKFWLYSSDNPTSSCWLFKLVCRYAGPESLVSG